MALLLTSWPYSFRSSLAVFTYHGAVQRNTREHAVCARVRQNLGMQRGVSIGRGSSSHWSTCHRSIRADGEFIFRQFLHPLAVHDQHYNVGGFDTNLRAEAPASEPDRRGPAPRASMTADPESAAIVTAHQKGALLQPRNNDDALRFFQQIARDAFVWSAHDLAENVRRRSQPVIGCVLLSPQCGCNHCGAGCDPFNVFSMVYSSPRRLDAPRRGTCPGSIR